MHWQSPIGLNNRAVTACEPSGYAFRARVLAFISFPLMRLNSAVVMRRSLTNHNIDRVIPPSKAANKISSFASNSVTLNCITVVSR